MLRFFAGWSTWVSSRAEFCLYARQLLADATATPAARRRSADQNPYSVMPPTSVAALHSELVTCHKRLGAAKIQVERERRRAEVAKKQVVEQKAAVVEVSAQLAQAREHAKKHERNATHLQWKLASTSMKATAVKAMMKTTYEAQTHAAATAVTTENHQDLVGKRRVHKAATVTGHHMLGSSAAKPMTHEDHTHTRGHQHRQATNNEDRVDEEQQQPPQQQQMMMKKLDVSAFAASSAVEDGSC